MDRPYKEASPSRMEPRPGDCSSPFIGDSCCNSWSPGTRKDLDFTYFFHTVTALSLWAHLKIKQNVADNEMKNMLCRSGCSLLYIIQGLFLSQRTAVGSLSGIQKRVMSLFRAQGGVTDSPVPQMLVLHVSEGKGAAPFILHACWCCGAESQTAHLCGGFLPDFFHVGRFQTLLTSQS